MPVPTKEQVIAYLKKNENATYTSISKRFSIKIQTVGDLIEDLKKEKKVTVTRIGTANVVNIKK